jgi:hypothetical protein
MRVLAALLAISASLVACSGARPPERSGSGWTLLDTCAPSIARKACPDVRGPDLDKCMASVAAGFDAQPTAEAQRAYVVQRGCPTYIAGEKP